MRRQSRERNARREASGAAEWLLGPAIQRLHLFLATRGAQNCVIRIARLLAFPPNRFFECFAFRYGEDNLRIGHVLRRRPLRRP
jgi:hypothetical protein